MKRLFLSYAFNTGSQKGFGNLTADLDEPLSEKDIHSLERMIEGKKHLAKGAVTLLFFQDLRL